LYSKEEKIARSKGSKGRRRKIQARGMVRESSGQAAERTFEPRKEWGRSKNYRESQSENFRGGATRRKKKRNGGRKQIQKTVKLPWKRRVGGLFLGGDRNS